MHTTPSQSYNVHVHSVKNDLSHEGHALPLTCCQDKKSSSTFSIQNHHQKNDTRQTLREETPLTESSADGAVDSIHRHKRAEDSEIGFLRHEFLLYFFRQQH